MRTSPLAIVVVLLLGVWLLVDPIERFIDRKTVEPRAVTARGDLAGDEINTIDIFRANSPSVVYVTSIALRRSFFSLNAVEIPQGTGSGFIWDRQGRIVTNYHVISDASRVRVTMADSSTWKAVLVGAAPDKDIAVLQIDAPKHLLQPIAIGSSKDLLVGQILWVDAHTLWPAVLISGLNKAGVAELVDAADSKSAGGNTLGVRVSPSVPII